MTEQGTAQFIVLPIFDEHYVAIMVGYYDGRPWMKHEVFSTEDLRDLMERGGAGALIEWTEGLLTRLSSPLLQSQERLDYSEALAKLTTAIAH